MSFITTLYTEFGITLIGVRPKMHTSLILNPPTSYRVEEGDVGFYIATPDNNARFLAAMRENDEMTKRFPMEELHRPSSAGDLLELREVRGDPLLRGLDPHLRKETPVPPTPKLRDISPSPSMLRLIDYIDDGCYWRTQQPRTQEEATIEDALDFTEHIVVCHVQKGIEYLIMPLRSSAMRHMVQVVLLTPTPIPDDIWVTLSNFPEVFVLVASPTLHESLRLANIGASERVIILQFTDVGGRITQYPDAESVMLYKTISRLAPGRPVVELEQGSSIDLLRADDSDRNVRIDLTRASFNNLALSHHDRMQFINRRQAEKELLKQLEERKTMLLGDKEVAKPGLLKPYPLYQFDATFASGQVYSSTLCDSLICQEFFRPFVMNIITLLTFHDGSGMSQLFLIPVPQFFHVRLHFFPRSCLLTLCLATNVWRAL